MKSVSAVCIQEEEAEDYLNYKEDCSPTIRVPLLLKEYTRKRIDRSSMHERLLPQEAVLEAHCPALFQGVQHAGALWLQGFLLAASQLAMTRAQTAANALADRIEELAIHATFVQASHSGIPFFYSSPPNLCLGGSRWACPS